MEAFTHLAAPRLGPNGELYKHCDGSPLDPLPPLYEKDDNSPDSPHVVLVFCLDCTRLAREVSCRRSPSRRPPRD